MRPIWKWIIGGVLLSILVLVGVIWYYSHNWKPIVEAKLKEVVHYSTNGLYTLQYEDLDLNIGLGNATLSNAELIPDSAVYRRMVEAQEAPNNRYHIKIKKLRVRNFSLLDALSKKKLNIRTILLEEPSLHLISEYHSFNDTIRDKSRKTLYESIKNIFTAVNVRDIHMDNIKFRYTKYEAGNRSVMNLEKAKVSVHDVLIDETSLEDTSRLYYTKMVLVEIPGFEYDLPGGFYKAKFKGLKINTREQNVLFTDVEYRPRMNKATFYKLKKQNVTMAVLKFDTLRVEHLDFKELIDNQKTLAAKVQLKNGAVDLSADKRYPKYPVVKIGHSPHQKLMKMTKLLRLDTVVVDNVSVTYHEMSGKYFREGSISFNHATGVLTNVTNDTMALKKDRFMRADLKARIMNTGSLHAKFGFDMLSPTGYHTYSGTLGPMQATAFDRILRPLLNVEITSGNIKHIAFNMEGTDRKNWGEFRFDYDNLKINILNKVDEKGTQSSKKVVSYLINHILINDSNPDDKGEYHIGKVNYARVPEHTFFKTLWQSLLEGIKQCTGISKEREAKLMGLADTGKDVVDKGKDIVEGAKDVTKKTGNFIKGLFKKKDNSKEDSKN